MQYARVVIERSDAGWVATPTGGRGSNLIGTVARANGLAIVPAGTETARAGSEIKVMLFRSAED
jgi:molybdopterin biosynthesis enzyme